MIGKFKCQICSALMMQRSHISKSRQGVYKVSCLLNFDGWSNSLIWIMEAIRIFLDRKSKEKAKIKEKVHQGLQVQVHPP